MGEVLIFFGALYVLTLVAEMFDREKKPSERHCPVCGYYCLGRGGAGCIDKPGLVEREQGK